MSWSYDVSQLTTKKEYQVRYAIGDVDSADPLLQDEEIALELVNSGGNIMAASIECCDRIAARYAKQGDIKLGPYAVDLGKRADRYAALANRLRKRTVGLGIPTYTGATTKIFDIDGMSATPDHVSESEV